jgi:hypothetical protein
MQGSEMYGQCHMSVGWGVYSVFHSSVVLVVDTGGMTPRCGGDRPRHSWLPTMIVGDCTRYVSGMWYGFRSGVGHC